VIRVEEVPEPLGFDCEARRPGNAWLAANPHAKSDSFPDLWSPFRNDLALGFQNVCGYCAMWTGDPSVDHYIAKESTEGRPLTYEWKNYRFADRRMNSRKRLLNARILDPYLVGSEWFEILLPKLEMIVVEERIPKYYHDDAHYTLKLLRLGNDDDIVEIRKEWYQPFIDGDVNLSYLTRKAPLIARAVKKRLSEINDAACDDGIRWFHEFADGDCTLSTLRKHASRLADVIDVTLDRPDPRSLRRRT